MIPTLHLRLLAGTATDLVEVTGGVQIRRGVDLDGVTDQPVPAAATFTVKGTTATNPLTNDDVRPDRPVSLQAGIEDTYGDGITWHTLWTGKILRARIDHDTDAKHDPDAYRVQITATDLVPDLAALPSEVAVAGNLTQRVDAILDGTPIPYAVADLGDPTSTPALPTDGKTALDQLRLIRDTLHATMYVDRVGVLQLVADNSRPRAVVEPDLTATDEDTADPTAVRYHDITPVFDTDAVVNVLTIEALGEETVETTYTDEDSRAAWGDHAQTVTVNDGLPETHAGLYLATRVDPDLVPESLVFLVDPLADTYPAHLAAACAIEIGQTIDVTRLGRVHRLHVRELAHTITPVLDVVPRLRWTVEVGLRVPDVLATRWDDVPADLTWDTVPADLTWDDAVNWHPYLEGA